MRPLDDDPTTTAAGRPAPEVEPSRLPEVVLLAQGPCSDDIRAMLREPWARRAPVRYFVGTPMNSDDLLVRVRAQVTPSSGNSTKTAS